MSFLDDITGGGNKKAEGDLANILAQIQAIQTPTAGQLQMTPLTQYSNTGDIPVALMQAAAAGPSAFDAEKMSSIPTETMQQVLSRQMQVAEAGGMTPQEKAAIAEAEQEMNRNVAGQRGAIAQDFAGRGVPQSLIAAALENATIGQNAQQAYRNALQGQSAAADRGQEALTNAGQLAGQMYNQESGQANTIAAAQNALNQFNAANTQQANLANQSNTQAANVYGTTNKQNIANENVTGQHQVQEQNQVNAPQQAASLALQKASALSNIGQAQANQATGAGQQAAGLFSGLLGAGATLGAGALSRGTVPLGRAEGGEIPDPTIPATDFVAGGSVPGRAAVPGDSSRNDTVPANLSPGEFVVPRTAMANPMVRDFLDRNVPTPRPPSAHPSDVASILKALSMLRGSEA